MAKNKLQIIITLDEYPSDFIAHEQMEDQVAYLLGQWKCKGLINNPYTLNDTAIPLSPLAVKTSEQKIN